MHFRENLHFIFNHNLKADVGQFRFQVGVNLFADMVSKTLFTMPRMKLRKVVFFGDFYMLLLFVVTRRDVALPWRK